MGQITGNEGLVLGWNVGGTGCTAVVGGRDGNLRRRTAWPSQADRGPAAMVADFVARAVELRAEFPGMRAVGVSIGGPLDPRRGVILSPPHLPGWDAVPLRDELRSALGLPVTVEHDAAACLLAEVLWGAAAGATHAVYLTCGTGCGAGVLIDGRILRGARGESPEFGHVRLADDGPAMYGVRGCVESFCSGEGIAGLAPFRFPEHFAGRVGTEALARAAQRGDAAAAAVLDEAAWRTGQACAMLSDIFAPQVMVLGSLARYLGERWVARVREGFAAAALPANAAGTRIVGAGLGDRLQDLSAIAPLFWHEEKRIALG